MNRVKASAEKAPEGLVPIDPPLQAVPYYSFPYCHLYLPLPLPFVLSRRVQR